MLVESLNAEWAEERLCQRQMMDRLRDQYEEARAALGLADMEKERAVATTRRGLEGDGEPIITIYGRITLDSTPSYRRVLEEDAAGQCRDALRQEVEDLRGSLDAERGRWYASLRGAGVKRLQEVTYSWRLGVMARCVLCWKERCAMFLWRDARQTESVRRIFKCLLLWSEEEASQCFREWRHNLNMTGAGRRGRGYAAASRSVSMDREGAMELWALEYQRALQMKFASMQVVLALRSMVGFNQHLAVQTTFRAFYYNMHHYPTHPVPPAPIVARIPPSVDAIPPKPTMRQARQPRGRNKEAMPELPSQASLLLPGGKAKSPPKLHKTQVFVIDTDKIAQRLQQPIEPPAAAAVGGSTSAGGDASLPVSRERRRSIERAEAKQKATAKRESEASMLADDERKKRLQQERTAKALGKKACSGMVSMGAREEMAALEMEATERARLKRLREKDRSPPRPPPPPRAERHDEENDTVVRRNPRPAKAPTGGGGGGGTLRNPPRGGSPPRDRGAAKATPDAKGTRAPARAPGRAP